MITIVCCIGNKKIFDLRLGASLKGHEKEYILISPPLNLTLSQSYNSINLDEIKTKYIMFVHEDVYFYDKNWIKKVEEYCDKIENLGVAGIAGVKVGGGYANAVGNIDHWGSRGLTKRRGFGNPKWDNKIVSVQTLDSLCFIVPTEVLQKYKFNEDFPFHMMIEDYCLTLKYNYNLGIYVIPLRAWHNEGGFRRKKIHGNLEKWHEKLLDKWWDQLKDVGIYITSAAFGLKKTKIRYCSKCGADLQLLPDGSWECRICHLKQKG